MNSYKQLIERKEEIKKYHGLTDNEVHILTFRNLKDLDEEVISHINLNNPMSKTQYTKASKIILMTTASVQRCLHLQIMPIDKDNVKSMSHLVIDEFDFSSCIIPRLDYLVKSMMTASKSKKTIMDYVKENWSWNDWIDYDSNKLKYLIAHYLKHNDIFGISTIYITSEILPMKILEALGFSSTNIGEKEFKHHTIYYKSDLVTRYTFNRLNNENKWGIFGFETIISDRYDEEKCKLNKTIEIINHIECRGSNKFKGNNKLLSIISHVPEEVIRNITDAINFFYECDEVTYEQVKATYYRDRLYQAVGRVLGYRGETDGVKDTWVLISDTIMSALLKYINNGDISIPYTLTEWELNCKEWDELVENVKNDNRLSDNTKIQIAEIKNVKNKEEARNIIRRWIKMDNEGFVSTKILRMVFKNAGVTGITTPFVANYFGLKESVYFINGKSQRGLKGISIDRFILDYLNIK